MPGICLLRACRQIYHEAASLLYSDNFNSFVFVSKEQRRISGKLPTVPLLTAPTWLMPSPRMSFLKKIEISLDLVCWVCSRRLSCVCAVDRFGRESMTGYLNFTPLLKMLWSYEEPPFEVNLVKRLDWARHDPDPTLYQKTRALLNGSFYPIKAASLNNLVRRLGYEDELDLKKYQRWIAEVCVSEKGKKGAVFYQTSYAPEGPIRWESQKWGLYYFYMHYFETVASGDPLYENEGHFRYEPKEEATFFRLPDHLYWDIVMRALDQYEDLSDRRMKILLEWYVACYQSCPAHPADRFQVRSCKE